MLPRACLLCNHFINIPSCDSRSSPSVCSSCSSNISVSAGRVATLWENTTRGKYANTLINSALFDSHSVHCKHSAWHNKHPENISEHTLLRSKCQKLFVYEVLFDDRSASMSQTGLTLTVVCMKLSSLLNEKENNIIWSEIKSGESKWMLTTKWWLQSWVWSSDLICWCNTDTGSVIKSGISLNWRPSLGGTNSLESRYVSPNCKNVKL